MGQTLNKQQEKAVKLIGKPVLIFAGAGSGKTRVLTEKIAYLVDQVGIPPEHILSVTFTNKAASEMKERILSLIRCDVSKMTVGTFHSVCASLLRKHINILGYDNSFTIYDQNDAKQAVKNVITSMSLDVKTFQPNKYQYLISNLKNKMMSPEDVLLKSDVYVDEILCDIYTEYNKLLKENNAVDFDDLLLLPIELFKKEKSLLSHYQNKFQYVLVDEYQDTNKPQFEFIYSLSKNNNEITVVGDDDQSIYAWRGADINNILNFSKSFPNASTVKLEQNYRSTKTILDAAYHVVSKNQHRADKKLWTDNDVGEPIHINEFENENKEASGVVDDVLESAGKDVSLNDMVLLYRTNSQSRVIEDRLRRESVPYHIVGGMKFYDRKEIKDILAYLRYLINPKDSIAFFRIVNFPPRGIGKSVTDKILKNISNTESDLPQTLAELGTLGLSPKQIEKVTDFINMIERIKSTTELTALETVETLISEIEVTDYYTNKDNPEDYERVENIQELVSSISDFTDRNESNSIEEFIEEVSLLTDIDRWNVNEQKLTLMTLHSSKGLEFKNVYILGAEEGLLPLSHGDDDDDLEEERRLFYVGVTRGIEKVSISYANTRRRFGSGPMFSLRSSFIDAIPEELCLLSNKTTSTSSYMPSFNSKNRIKKKSTLTPDTEFKVSDMVEHKLYGKGRITDVQGVGENSKITIKFRGNVVKKFIKKYANLKNIN